MSFSIQSSRSRVLVSLLVVFVFYLVLDFWLAWSTGLPVLAFQLVYLTQLLDRNLSHTSLPVLF